MSGPDEPTSLQPLPDPGQDQVAALLSSVLTAEAARIEPTDRLGPIRTAGASRRLSWAPVAAAVAAVLVVGGGTWALVDRGPGDDRPSAAASPSPTATSTPDASTATTEPTTPSAGQPVTVPVYFPSSLTKGLFREFIRTRAKDSHRLFAAQKALQLAVDPTAPTKAGDVSRWLPGTAAALRADIDGDEVMWISVPAAEGQARGRSAEDARLAAQQLVWTATAALQDPNLRVTIQLGSHASPHAKLFGSLPLDQPFMRPPASTSYTDLAAIWILQPEPGSTVGRVVTFAGQACTFEANVAWQVLAGAKVVQSGHTTAKQGCPVRSDWSVAVKGLAPGSYTFRAYSLSPKDGKTYEGLDTTTFTVR